MINSIVIASLINFGTLYVELHAPTLQNEIILSGFSTTNIENLAWVENIENDEITSVNLQAQYYDNTFNFIYDNNGTFENGELYDETYGPLTISLNNSDFLEDLNAYRRVDIQKNIYTNSYAYIENISIYLNTNSFYYDASNNYFYLVCDFEIVIKTLNDSYAFTGLENFIVSYDPGNSVIVENIFSSYSSQNSIFSCFTGEVFLNNTIFVEKFDAYTAGYNQGFSSGNNSGYDAGYDSGYDAGYDAGYDVGVNDNTTAYNNGYDAGVASNSYKITDIIGGAFNSVSGLFNMEILPGIKFIYVIGIPLVIAVLRFVIGWFR